MYDNYSCCQPPEEECGFNNGCGKNSATIYVIIVLFVLCAFAKRSCICH